MKTKVFLLSMLAVLFAACEKSKNEPQPQKGMENGHEWVDLGLSIKWATCNVGATKPEEYGDYFAWGETKPKEVYDWSTYFDTKDGGSTFIKYNNDGGKTTLDLTDDAAYVNWGGSWRMPTKAEQDELRNNCTWTRTQKNGINGYEVKGTNGNTIFFPASGYRDNSSLYGVGFFGHYWPSSLNEGFSGYVRSLLFGSTVHWNFINRYLGQSVRPVCQ